jgi:serine/threonine protein phosphatase PrpC
VAISLESCTAQHIGDREEQQDRVAMFPNPKYPGALMIALADGMGGLSGGSLAAEQVIHAAKHNFDAFGPGGDVKEVLAGCINDAHEGIQLAAMTSGLEPHSTACILVMQPGRVDWAHCGDSRIYHFRNGQLLSRTVDHSMVMRKMVLPGYITEEQAEQHPNKNLLMSCLGDHARPEMDFGESAPLQAGDCFFVCSDGIWAYFSTEELGGILTTMAPRQAAETLIERARERAKGRGDNCSIAILKLVEVETPKKGPMLRPFGAKA